MTQSDRVRRLTQWLFASCLWTLGVFWWAKRDLKQTGAIIVLTLHRVLDETRMELTCSLPGTIVRSRTFDRLCEHLRSRYCVIPAEGAAPGRAQERPTVVVTFDDGWKDTADTAWPIAKRHAIPFTVFVCPDLTDRVSPFWPETVVAYHHRVDPSAGFDKTEALIEDLKRKTPQDRDLAIAELKVKACRAGCGPEGAAVDSTMSWEDIQRMQDGLVSFGSHTNGHVILTTVSAEIARAEMQSSSEALARRLHGHCDSIAYPNGDASDEILAIAGELGYRYGFTTQRRVWTSRDPALAIPRGNVYEANIVNPLGRFSRIMFEYTAIWKPWLSSRRWAGL